MTPRNLKKAVILRIFLIGLVLILPRFGILAYAQSITGTVAGTVTDQQGLAVPSAAVKATNVDTGIIHTTISNERGEYRIEFLNVGTYVIEIKAANFKTFLQKNVPLLADQTQRVDASLQLGAITETITITDAPPLVDTSTAELGRTIGGAEINQLPLVNRNAYAELSLTAGVQTNSSSGQTNPNGTPNFTIGVPSNNVIVNGGIDGGVPMVSYYLDGGINMTGLRNYGNPLPNPDALEEVRVETNNFAAQYGRMSGAVVTAVTKSGTNKFHGSLFEFNRNTDLNATPWGLTINAPYHRNQFGGSIGGPIKHDRAFFFFSYGGLRQSIGQPLTGSILPTTAQREGDFTSLSTPVNMPGTQVQVDGTNSAPNCATAKPNCVPSALLDKTAANLLAQYIPLPTNLTNGSYSGYFTGPTTQNEYLGKYDQAFSKDHIAGSYFYLTTTQNAYGGGNIPYSINQSFAKQQVLNLSDIHTINAVMVNQGWITITRVVGGRVNLPTVDMAALGSTFTSQGPKALPQISVSGYFSAGGALAGPVSDSNFFSIRDMVSISKGKHSINVGGEVSLEKDLFAGNNLNFGSFTFSKSAPTTTGNALADLITGQVATMEQDTPYSSVNANWYYALFLQDVYKILPRVTLNLGLRYDVQTAPVEASNLTASFIPGVQSKVVPSAPLGMLFVGDAGVPRGAVGTKYHHVSPRIGIVWDPFGDGKTAIRAGGGVFYGSVTGGEWNQPATSQPFAIRQTFNSITSFSNVYGNPASFPTGDPFPYHFNFATPRFLPAASIEAIAPNYQWPLAYQTNLAIQRQLPLNISTTFAYVGTFTRHVPFIADVNYAPYAPGANLTQASINARRPYDPGVLGQVGLLKSVDNASYHSLQITASRPLTHNLQINGFYVLSHSFVTVSPDGVGVGSAQDFANIREERGPADNDRRHVASIAAIWNLQYYKGSSFALKEVLNGWTVSPIVSLQSGAPFTIATGANNNLDSANQNRPNAVPGVNPALDPHRSRPAVAAAWFNTAAFVPNGPGALGGIGPGGADGNVGRDTLRGPGYRDVDLGLFRDFHFERGIVFQVRGEATNAFNLVSLNPPTANLASSLNGKITSAFSPRLIQVGGRLTF
jgi:Carboxypeptidase regulatory-like domain